MSPDMGCFRHALIAPWDANDSIFHPMDIRATRQIPEKRTEIPVGEIPDHALQWPGLGVHLPLTSENSPKRAQGSRPLASTRVPRAGSVSPCSRPCPPQAGSFVLSVCNALKVFPSLRKSRRFHE